MFFFPFSLLRFSVEVYTVRGCTNEESREREGVREREKKWKNNEKKHDVSKRRAKRMGTRRKTLSRCHLHSLFPFFMLVYMHMSVTRHDVIHSEPEYQIRSMQTASANLAIEWLKVPICYHMASVGPPSKQLTAHQARHYIPCRRSCCCCCCSFICFSFICISLCSNCFILIAWALGLRQTWFTQKYLLLKYFISIHSTFSKSRYSLYLVIDGY